MDYISREAAIKRFNFAVLDCLGMEPTIRAGDIIKALESIPTADVRPVTHGKWIRKKQKTLVGAIEQGLDWKEYYSYECSVCGFDTGEQARNWNFCPNCGADMREES